jgi:methyl-accepting chemotaxis protein
MRKTWFDSEVFEEEHTVRNGTAFLGIGILVIIGGYIRGPLGLMIGGLLLALVVGATSILSEGASEGSAHADGSKTVSREEGPDRSPDGSSAAATDASSEEYRQRIETLEAERDDLKERLEQEQRRNERERTLLDTIETVSRQGAEGDLSTRLDEESIDHDLVEAFNELLDRFESTIREVETFTGLVAETGDQVVERTDAVEAASEQVLDLTTDISDGADRQRDQLRTARAEMDDLSENVGRIAGLTTEVATAAEQTVETGHEGRAAAGDAIRGIQEIESGAAEAVDAIETLHEEMQTIDELVESIGNLAAQTNMLALNANIEASRSSDRGAESDDGFGVVATEVKELADESQETADTIETRIQRLQSEGETATKKVRAVERKLSTHAESIQTALHALDEITEHAEATHKGVRKIDMTTREQTESADAVVSLINDTVSIGEETASLAERTRTTTAEQTEWLSGMSERVTSLTDAATSLQRTIARFSLDDSEDGQTSLGDADGSISSETPQWAGGQEDSSHGTD